jgi:hypothetical protein
VSIKDYTFVPESAGSRLKLNKMTKKVYLTQQEFDRDLEDCLTIINYPDKYHNYYVVEYISPALYKSIVHIYIKN